MTIPATQLNQNQFALKPIVGMLDLKLNTSTIMVEIDSSSAGSLLPGQPVKIVDSAGGIPKVVECALNSEDVFGFLDFTQKDRVFNAGDKAEMSFGRGNVMYMSASAAISRNGKVAIVVSLTNPQVVAATTGMTIVGRALDKAVNPNDLIRVYIDLPGSTA